MAHALRARIGLVLVSALVAACSGGEEAAVVGSAGTAVPKAVAQRGVDADGNGRADVWFVNSAGTLLRWSMNGAQIAAQSQVDVGPGWRVIDSSGDYNGDGRSDILWRNVDGTVVVWLMDGAAQVGSAVLGTVPADWVIADGRGDYDGDGRSDILWRNGAGTVAIWRMNGTSIAGTSFPATVPAEWSIVSGAGDYDGDGRSDVLWRNANGVIAIWRMNGGTIQGATFLPGVGSEWSAVDGAGDYNGDGRSDVLWRSSSGQVVAWFMNGTVAGTASLGAVDSAWRIVDARSDFDGDGRSDLLWQRSTGEILLWTISGGTRTGAVSVGGVGPEWLVGAGSGATDGRARGAAPPAAGGGGGGGGGPSSIPPGDPTGGATDRGTSGYRDTLLTGRWEFSAGDNPDPAIGQCVTLPAFVCPTPISIRFADYGFIANGLQATEITRAEIYAGPSCTGSNRSVFELQQPIQFKGADTQITDGRFGAPPGTPIAVREGEYVGEPTLVQIENSYTPPAGCNVVDPPPTNEACTDSLSIRIEQVNGLPRLFKQEDSACQPGTVKPPARFATTWFTTEGQKKR